jgi:hypothetical protein
MIVSPYLDGRDRYERRMEGWTDNTHDDAFTHTVRLADDDRAIVLRAVCTASPGYELREASARVVDGARAGAEVSLAGLGGARMIAGFTRRLAEVAGADAEAALVVDAGIEIARLARQVGRVPAARVAAVVAGGPRACWALDREAWADLPDSCFTYSAAGAELLGSRTVTSPMTPALYGPPPGARRVFQRRKLARLVRTGPRLDLFHAMHDDVHGFDIHYEIDLERGVIAAAHSVTSRLPYRGICDEPQRSIDGMVGQAVNAGLRKRIQTVLGGSAGCAQLYDLTADLLKLCTLA